MAQNCEVSRVAVVAEWSRYRIVAGLATCSSPLPLKTRRVGQRYTLNLSRAQASSFGMMCQYGGYVPRLVTEWVRVRIPSKTWLYLLRERSRSFTCNGFPSRKEKQRTPFLVICWDHRL
ncbi:hypothetical protein TNCV_1636581 [Trichonephila clavipes]|nr:hypothetical protein TNCV_1636581 [Trichonephila clavipes]